MIELITAIGETESVIALFAILLLLHGTITLWLGITMLYLRKDLKELRDDMKDHVVNTRDNTRRIYDRLDNLSHRRVQ